MERGRWRERESEVGFMKLDFIKPMWDLILTLR